MAKLAVEYRYSGDQELGFWTEPFWDDGTLTAGESFSGADGVTYQDIYVREHFDNVVFTFAGSDFEVVGERPFGSIAYLEIYDAPLGFWLSVTDISVSFNDLVEASQSGDPLRISDFLVGDDLVELSPDSDVITTGSGDDTIYGNGGNDQVFAQAGDDIYFKGGDVDVFDGAAGFDVMVVDGARAEFEFRRDGLSAIGNSQNAAAWDDLEKVQFDDGAYLLDMEGPSAEFVYRVYAAAYGRTPDEGGLRFWTGVLEDRVAGAPGPTDQKFIADFFLSAGEFVDLYGADSTDLEYIAAMYANVLDRVPDQSGYDFWVGAMASGLTRGDVLVSFAESQENVAQTAPDVDNGLWVL